MEEMAVQDLLLACPRAMWDDSHGTTPAAGHGVRPSENELTPWAGRALIKEPDGRIDPFR